MVEQQHASVAAKICDCFPSLSEVGAAREARYRENPDLAHPVGPQAEIRVRVKSVGWLNEVGESVLTGRTWDISEPESVGGRDDAPYPLEYLLGGAVGCFAAVFAFYAAKYGVDYDTFVVEAAADIDISGHVIEGSPPPGFQRVSMNVYVTGPASQAELERVHEAALAGCPGIDTLRRPMEVVSSLTVGAE